jgi:hypothetical protein
VRPLRAIFILGTVKFGVKKTLIASTDHISMMFKPAPETLGKTPSRKKRSKERGPKSKPKERNPKCITKGSWNNHVPEPPPIARRNGIIYLFHYESGTKPHPSRCNMNCSRSRGRLMALTYYR